ncbi:guanylyl cyclase-activating protein 3 isoform X3 [Pogona vitticeps]|uniref:Guanylyl cyclase-activating protein 3 isoform X3 n=1 Tax=Pogona vitticeps TaxID=103695 RepID=A0A6J0URX2_9SAUR
MGISESKEDFDTLDNGQWYAKFMKECPSGQLSVFECKKMLGLANASAEANSHVEKVFNIFDTNQDGFIDFLEFIAAINLVIRGKIDQKLKWYFKLYDADGSGTIDKKELLSIFSAIQTINGNQDMTPEEFANMVFQKIDVNNDGELSLEEFISGIESDETLLEVISKSFDLSNVLKVIQSGRRHSV